MAFPGNFDRVLYRKNPLHEVICQVKFPTILRIASELPSKFQDRIRARFPLFEEPSENQIEIPAEFTKVISQQLQLELGPGRNYNFLSEDRAWRVNLTRDFLALTCRTYERWELFKEQLQVATAALHEEYQPAFFSRVGLRYRNVIRRSRLELVEVPWKRLLRAELAGELADQEFADHLKGIKKELLFDLPYETEARIFHGLAKTKVNNEQVYVIDTDFFSTQRTEVNDVWERLGRFNEYARSVFRWAITEELHRAMGPSGIDTRRH